MGVQLPLALGQGKLPLNPEELTELTALERGRLYAGIGLGTLQRVAAEEAVLAVIARRYRRAT